MKFLKMFACMALIMGPGMVSTGIAKEEGNRAVRLEDLVVTATKTSKKVDEAPGSVSLITRGEIERRNIKTVDEALSEIQGVFVKRSKGFMDATSSVSMRGFTGDQYTLILMDGQPLNDSYNSGLEWGLLPVGNIERIEVVRGAASALYGGNAMGGVINIITRTPEQPEASVTGGIGTNSTRRYRLSVGNRFADKASLRVGYEKESTDGYVTTPVRRTITAGAGTVNGGYPMNDEFGSPKYWIVGDKGKNGAEKRSIDAKATLDCLDTGRLSLTLMSGKHEYDYGPPNTYMGTFGDNTTYAVAGPGQRARFRPNRFIDYTGIGRNETDVYTLAFERPFGPATVSAQVGTVRVNDRYTQDAGGSLDTYWNAKGTLKITENESWFSEVRVDMPLLKGHVSTLGASFRSDSSNSNDYNVPFYRSYSNMGASTFYSGGKDRVWSLFLQDEWRLSRALTLYLGGRYDGWKLYDGASGAPGAETLYESSNDSEFSPKANLVWKALEDTTLRCSAGHAFRPPNLYELYRSWTSWGWTYVSNPRLSPETTWTYEIGADQYLFDRKTRLSATGFRNDIKDLVYSKINNTAMTKTRMNAGKGRTYGLELEASHQVTKWLKAWGNFTYTSAKIIECPLDPDSKDKSVTGIPRTAYNIGLDFNREWFKGSLVGRYFGKIYDDSDNKDIAEGVYGTYEPAFYVDGKVTFTPWRHTDISLSVDNLFDKEYYEYYIQDGRSWFCELTIRY